MKGLQPKSWSDERNMKQWQIALADLLRMKMTCSHVVRVDCEWMKTTLMKTN